MSGAYQLAAIHAQMERGEVAGARQAILEIVERDPGNGSALHLAGVVHRRAGDHQAAVSMFERAVAAGHETAELKNSLGLSLQDLGKAEEAGVAFARAVELDPDYIPAKVNAAKLQAATGDIIGASQVLEQTLVDHPDSALTSNSLAAILAEDGQARRAGAQYARTLERDPANLVAAVRGGMALRDEGKYRQALDHFTSLLPRFGQAPEFVDAMCGAMVDCGKLDEAETALEALTERVPGYFPAHRAIARLAREYGTEKDAYRSYRRLVANWPRESAIWLDWFSLQLAYRDHASVIGLIPQARQNLGSLPELDFFEAVARGEEGDAAAAEALFSRASSGLSDHNPFRVAWARNALRRGEPRQAEQLAQAAANSDQLDQFAWAYLGVAWRLLGDDREFWLHDYDRQVRQIPIPYLADAGDLECLCETLRRLHRAGHHPPDQSLRGGTQTEGALFQRSEPVIRRLRDSIREAVESYSSDLPVDDSHPYYGRRRGTVRFTGSWSVRLTGEGFHVAHLHQAGWVSSALHVTLPTVSSDSEPHAGYLVVGQPPTELGLGLEPRRIIKPVEGSLVLFPSSMWHGTVAFSGGHERMTVAFDAIPAG